MARRWRDWPGRFFEEVEKSKKAIAGAGIVGGAVGATAGGPVGAAFGSIGSTFISIGVCLVKARPVQLVEAVTLIGQDIALKRLKTLTPQLRRVGSIGVSEVGKTTLQSHLCDRNAPPNVRTEELIARISALPINPPQMYALIDGAGQQYSQQFDVFGESELLIICLDHSPGEKELNYRQFRLDQQSDFMDQLLGHARNTHKYPARIHFLLNKRDCWSDGGDAAAMRTWFSDIVQPWRYLPGLHITTAEHSNFIAQDIISVRQLLSTWLSEQPNG